MAKLTQGMIDGLRPRIRMSLGVTIPTSKNAYKYARPEIGLEIDKPEGMTTEQTMDDLETFLIERLDVLCDRLFDYNKQFIFERSK